MFIGVGLPIPNLSNLPGSSRPGGGGGGDFVYTAINNSYSMLFDVASGTTVNAGGADGSGIDLQWNKAFSSCAWVKIASGTTGNICGKMDPATSNGKGWKLAYTSSSPSTDKRLQVQISRTQAGPVALRNALYVTTTANEIPFDTWAHVGFTYDGSQVAAGIKLYVNGVEITNITDNSLSPPLTADIVNTVDVGIGGLNGTSTTSSFNGYMDESAFWNEIVLSDKTFEAIYNATANNPGKVADLSETPEGVPTAWYRMGD